MFKSKLICGISVDINSSYPAVMKAMMPVQHVGTKAVESNISTHRNGIILDAHHEIEKIESFNFYMISYKVNSNITCGISKTSDGNSLIEKKNDKDLWVTGAMFKNILIEAFNDAETDNEVFCTSTMVIRFKGQDIYKGYIDTFYNKRLLEKENPVKNALFKILLNSLYGKHAQKPQLVQKSFDNFEDMFEYVSSVRNRKDFKDVNYRFV